MNQISPSRIQTYDGQLTTDHSTTELLKNNGELGLQAS